MQLSLVKKFGFIHARGGKLLRVASGHSVPTIGWHEQAATAGDYTDGYKPPVRFPDGEKWVFCREGDLAIEIVAAKTSKVLGYAYLSGPAIQLHGYDTANRDRFRPAALERVTFERPPAPPDFVQADMERYVRWAMDLKYGKADAYVFNFQANDPDDGRGALHFIENLFGYEFSAGDSHECTGDDCLCKRPATANVMGQVQFGKRAKNGCGSLHFQPPPGSPFAVTPFQTGLLLSAV